MLNVLCVKHGSKYNAEYVNRLKRSVQRNLTVPHTFNCFTEDPRGIDDDVRIIPLPTGYPKHFTGWWWKPYMFKPGHFHSEDTNLFFDLDMIVVRPIDQLVTYMPGKFVGLRDLFRVMRPTVQRLGSAVMRWPANQYGDIWDKLDQDHTIIKRHRGDQEWVWHCHKDKILFYPDQWIRSYKWEVRNKSELTKTASGWNFRNVATPEIPKHAMVLAFHGTPFVHECRDPTVLKHWR